jgi:two-component system, NtrC family, nitrogen regulation sensor histidine kinase NtrY
MSMYLRRSLEGRFLLLAAALSVAAVLLTALLAWLLSSLPDALFVSLAVCVPLTVYAVRRFMAPITRLITALGDGVASFKDGDFSVSLNPKRDDELGALVNLYNAAGDVLRRERQSLYQRELMLDTVIQSTPWALVLSNANDRVV